MAIQITQGTETTVQTVAVGGTETQVVRLDVGSGATAAEFGGTIRDVANITKGTVTQLDKLVAGTVDTVGFVHATAFSTTVTTGTTTLGTIKAGVAGSTVYLTDVVVSVGSATTLVIGNGGTNLPLLGTLSFTANGGMVGNFRTPVFGSAGSAIVYQQSVGCPLSITANGYVK